MTTRPSSRRKRFSRDGSSFNLGSGRKCDLAQSYNLIKHSTGFLKTKIPDINSPRQTGTHQYKSKEEYYDEVLQARKEIVSIRHENSTLKTRCRRLEEDNIKKEREISGLLDPSKNEELRRTLTDRRSDSGSMVSGLKQKILKLESQLKANEASFQKLRSDVKTTRVEELQIQMETLYHEVTRLRAANKEQRAFKDNFNTTKIKALSETVLRLNQSMEELRGENFALKKEMMEMSKQGNNQRKSVECVTPKKTRANTEKLEDMNKQELLDLIETQNQIIEHFESKKKHLAEYLANRATNKVPGKVSLQGDVWRQVEQLDKQESQLLKELKVEKDKKKLMKSDKNRFKKRNEELEQECYKLQLTIKELELKQKTDHNNATTTTIITTATTTTTTPTTTTITTTNATSLGQHHRLRSSTAPHPDRLLRRGSKARETCGEDSKKVNQEGRISVKTRLGPTTEEVTKLRENHAAKSIQRAWRHHHHYYDHKDKQDQQAAAEERVQAAVKAHLARQRVLQRAREHITSGGGGGGGGMEGAVLLIQSVLRGHHTRKTRLLQNRGRNNPSLEPLMAR